MKKKKPFQVGLRVLVVEDNWDLAESIKICFENLEDQLDQNIEVETAETGREAKELLQANQYHLTVLDLHLPDMNGYDLYKDKLEQNDNPTIILSGNLGVVNPDSTRERLIYIEKPASHKKLERHFMFLLKDAG